MNGIIAVSGMAYANAYIIRETRACLEPVYTEDVERELSRLQAASKECGRQLSDLIDGLKQDSGEEQAAILEFQYMLLEDENYFGSICNIVKNEKVISEYAVSKYSEEYRQELLALDNEYLNQRASDIKDIEERLLKNLNSKKDEAGNDEPIIVVARDLTPSRFVELSRGDLKGIILEEGGLSSHCVILARSFNIPCMVGVTGAIDDLDGAKTILLDAISGQIIKNPTSEKIGGYETYQREADKVKESLEEYKTKKTETADGKHMGVYANITSTEEVSALKGNGGEGVGLLRTEMLYMEKATAPTREEQIWFYSKIAKELENRPLIIRTLDVGGDKKIPYLNIPEEENPFLGFRAIRFCLENDDIFLTQLEAILSSCEYGNVKIMIPMVSTIDEFKRAKEKIDSLAKTKSLNVQVGMMVETPAAAIMADRFAKVADFFSIGTNDLTQYIFAADRNNKKVAHLNSYFNPALLRAVANICKEARKEGIEVDICGQAGEVEELIPLWVGMGVDNLSVSIPSITRVRRTISRCDTKKCKALVEKVMELSTQDEVKELLEKEKDKWL